jgi:hypothetical protein
MCIHKRAVASSLDHELLVTIRINLECGHCLRAAAEGCYERPRRLSRADLVVDEVPGAGPIARGADIAGVQVRRTRPSHQLMIRYCDQSEHGQQQREICGSFHLHSPPLNLRVGLGFVNWGTASGGANIWKEVQTVKRDSPKDPIRQSQE